MQLDTLFGWIGAMWMLGNSEGAQELGGITWVTLTREGIADFERGGFS